MSTPITPSRPLFQTLFNMANAYNQAAELSLAAISQHKNADYAGPAIMSRSFAVELLLKFFIMAKHPSAKTVSELKALGINLHGHTYSQLFDRIDAAFVTLIAQKYSQVSGNATTAPDFRHVLIDLGDEPFVTWRYAYEVQGNLNLDLKKFSDVVEALGLSAQDIVQSIKAVGAPDSVSV